MALELRNRLRQRVGKTLPTTLAFDYPTVNALSHWLLHYVLTPAASQAERVLALFDTCARDLDEETPDAARSR